MVKRYVKQRVQYGDLESRVRSAVKLYSLVRGSGSTSDNVHDTQVASPRKILSKPPLAVIRKEQVNLNITVAEGI